MDNIDKLLYELKRVLSIIDNNYIKKIESILSGDSEYDKLFYAYVKNLDIDKSKAKQLCLDRINDVSRNKGIKDYYIKQELSGDIAITDIYKTLDICVSDYQDDIDNLQDLIVRKQSIVYGLKSTYDVDLNSEIIYIKLYLSHIFYSYMYSYINILNACNDSIDEENVYMEIYKLLNSIDDTKEVLNIFDNYIDDIIDIYYLYTDLEKHGKDQVHLKVLKGNNLNKAIHICPFSIVMYKDYFNMYYKGEKLKSIEIGNITLTILEDMIKDSYDNKCTNNSVYRRTIKIIKGSNKDYDTLKWFDYLTANVYENILNKENRDRDEKIFIDYINQGMTNVINNDYLLEYVLYKFYEFNNEIYDLKSLKDLRNSINNKDKIKIRKINPYYNDID